MTDYVSKEQFAQHTKNEEANQHVTNDALHEGNIRMGNIEMDLKELAQDLKPLLRLYHAFLGASAVMFLVATLLVFIYQADRKLVIDLADAVQKQGLVIERLITKHEEFRQDTAKELGRHEKALEKAGKL